jgi:hypothetical protein
VSKGAVQLKDTPFAFSEEFRLVGSALLRLIATHPMSISASLTLSDESPFTSFRSQGCSRAQLAIALTLPRAFLIQLHGLFYNEDEYSHNMAFKAAREILDIARELEGDNESYWELPMNVSRFRRLPNECRNLIFSLIRWGGGTRVKYSTKKLSSFLIVKRKR